MEAIKLEVKIEITVYCPHCDELQCGEDFEKQFINEDYGFIHADTLDSLENEKIVKCVDCDKEFLVKDYTY